MTLHGAGHSAGDIAAWAAAFVRDRLAADPGPGRVGDSATLAAALAGGITDAGLGPDAAWARFTDVVAPANLSLDSSRFLAFIPVSPSVAGVWMDAVVGAANFSAESWLEAAGAIAAETQVLDFLASTFGLPAGAGGCFMTGGSIGNLSALAVARDQAGGRRAVVVADTAHASVANALHLLGMHAVVAHTGPDCRLTGPAVREAATAAGPGGIAAIVASAGSTNGGVVDDLTGCADAAADLGAWLHVDGAYGLAAMLLPECRHLFAGIERADSLIVDPHKWLFAPAGSCALLYARPELAAATHTQRGPYIDVFRDIDGWNPSDLGFQLTRRASGLPIWFALTLHGVDAHRRAIRAGIAMAQRFAAALHASQVAEPVLEPELGVVLFRRHGWGRAQWQAWGRRCIDEGVAVVAPTTYRGEPVGRVVFMHPLTPGSIVDELLATLT
ncbi:MAG: aspartate aminotransferase family protein [Ilumatobacter sp.]|nr:aspartate aminotransferase family protein [Ilumatobacter sp.]